MSVVGKGRVTEESSQDLKNIRKWREEIDGLKIVLEALERMKIAEVLESRRRTIDVEHEKIKVWMEKTELQITLTIYQSEED